MIAFKGFHKDMSCTMGKGIFKYEVGKTYTEKECKCTTNGFHCCENPLDVLSYYGGQEDRFCIVKAEGDIDQDAVGTKIACTKMTIVKEITRLELAVHACEYIRKYPEREISSLYLKKDEGTCREKGNFVIVRGKNPKAKGVKGSYFFMAVEEKESQKIKGIYIGCADDGYDKPDTYYRIKGGNLCEEKN